VITHIGEVDNNIDKYIARPNTLKNVTMHTFFSAFQLVRRRYVQRPPGKEAIIIVNPHYKPNEDDADRREQYFRQQMLLYSVWRKEEPLKAPHSTWEEAFLQKKPACPLICRHFLQLTDDAEKDLESNPQVFDSSSALTPDMTAAAADSVGQRLNVSRKQDDWMLHMADLAEDPVEIDDAEDLKVSEKFDWSSLSEGFPVEDVGRFQDDLRRQQQLPRNAGRCLNVDPQNLNADQRRVYDFVRDNQRTGESAVHCNLLFTVRLAQAKVFSSAPFVTCWERNA
jgi:hypothetical protein